MAKEKKVVDVCPHCGQKLSPWQQVLLSVDRSLMCKNCWYRIYLDSEKKSEATDDQYQQREE